MTLKPNYGKHSGKIVVAVTAAVSLMSAGNTSAAGNSFGRQPDAHHTVFIGKGGLLALACPDGPAVVIELPVPLGKPSSAFGLGSENWQASTPHTIGLEGQTVRAVPTILSPAAR